MLVEIPRGTADGSARGIAESEDRAAGRTLPARVSGLETKPNAAADLESTGVNLHLLACQDGKLK